MPVILGKSVPTKKCTFVANVDPAVPHTLRLRPLDIEPVQVVVEKMGTRHHRMGGEE